MTAVVPEPAPALEPGEWTLAQVKELYPKLWSSNRELQLLLMFCQHSRTAIPAAELTAKFGCGDPIDAARDLSTMAAFCAARDRPHQRAALKLPIRRSAIVGDDKKPTYELAWTPAQADAFRDAARSGPPAANSDQLAVSTPPPTLSRLRLWRVLPGHRR